MRIERLSFVVPVPDLAQGVRFWALVLSAPPTFVDEDRWAQFDVGGVRLCLAGKDRVADAPGVMIKVTDVEAACTELTGLGYAAGAISDSDHERRSVSIGPGGCPLVLYASTSRPVSK